MAELLAFISGALLLRPAFRVNRVLKDNAALRMIFQTSMAQVDQQTIPAIRAELEKLSSTWNQWDDLCLKWGAGLFVLSGFIKLVLVSMKP